MGQEEIQKKYNRLFTMIFLVMMSFVAGFFTEYMFTNKQEEGNKDAHQVRQSGYRFINPLLECEVENTSKERALTGMKNKVQALIDKQTQEKKVESVSVYFRDLNNGPWFGINENKSFYPASLLKVPLAIAYFRRAEFEPDIFSKEIENTGDMEMPYEMQMTVPQEKLEAGKKYTVKDLIERMLVRSDNGAAKLLFENIDKSTINQVYPDLGMPVPGSNDSDVEMSVVSYASFFRMLFNASYLDREQSESLLEILSRADFKDGIVAGVPSRIAVAQKFGERSEVENGEIKKQLHDCGIVYYPKHPYLLCVMSQGNNTGDLSSTIQNVSKTIFEEVDKVYQ